MSSPGRGDLFIVSSPSGGGKTTLIRRLLATPPGPPLHFSISHTTRPMREGEENGREYHFITAEAFQGMVQRDEFLEHNQVHGHIYGTSRAEVLPSSSPVAAAAPLPCPALPAHPASRRHPDRDRDQPRVPPMRTLPSCRPLGRSTHVRSSHTPSVTAAGVIAGSYFNPDHHRAGSPPLQFAAQGVGLLAQGHARRW